MRSLALAPQSLSAARLQTTGLKIPVSGVQFSPCPPFLSPAKASNRHARRGDSRFNGPRNRDDELGHVATGCERSPYPRSYPRFFREGDLRAVVVDCAMDTTPLLVAEHGTIDDTGWCADGILTRVSRALSAARFKTSELGHGTRRDRDAARNSGRVSRLLVRMPAKPTSAKTRAAQAWSAFAGGGRGGDPRPTSSQSPSPGRAA
jgi:hypothetical protein